jgi:hypothetical protein
VANGVWVDRDVGQVGTFDEVSSRNVQQIGIPKLGLESNSTNAGRGKEGKAAGKTAHPESSLTEHTARHQHRG